MKGKQVPFTSRVTVVSVLIVVTALVIIGRLFFLQILRGKDFEERADRQFVGSASTVFDMGNIYFTRKDGQKLEAATVIVNYKLAISPKDIASADRENIYNKLSAVVPIDHADFMAKAAKASDPYEEIAQKVDSEQIKKIRELNIKGVSFPSEKQRFYPGKNLASQTIGLVAFKDDVRTGRYGLEKYYNDILGRGGDALYINFFAEVFSNISSTLFKNKDGDGDIVTTIEPTVQQYVEEELGNIMKKWKSDSAGAIVMNPKDGSIYAMAFAPGFDPNNLKDVKDIKVLSNPLVENVYEFGSVIKPLVMAGALDMGVVTAETSYYDKGYVEVSGQKINNFDKVGRGQATMQDVLNQSLNTGMVFTEQKMGKDAFRRYMLSYGIGEKTGIDLPNEGTGLVSNLYSKGEVEYATASFGQGIAMTPIEAIRALASISNGGKLVTPHLMSSISFAGGGSKTYEPSTKQTELKPETSVKISRMLTTIVDKAMGSGQYKLEHYTIAAKTGTAQIPLPSGKGYYSDRNLHSLFGYFPAYDPKFVMIFFTEYPKGPGSDFAATTVAEPFMSTAKFLLNYYDVPPDR